MTNRVLFIGLGGNSYGPLLQALNEQTRTNPRVFVLVDGKHYRAGQEDHEFFLRHGNKARIQQQFLTTAYPQQPTKVEHRFVARTTTKHTIAANDLLKEHDTIILFVDNHETRKLVLETGQARHNLTIINAAIDHDDVHVWVHLRREGRDVTRPPLNRYPELSRASNELPKSITQRAGCLETATQPQTTVEERPNYYALVTASILTLTTLSLVQQHDETGQALPYTDAWLNVRTLTTNTNYQGVTP